MSPAERRATWSLCLIYMVRMIGLFIILPVFSLFAHNYSHSTPLLAGLAIGIYGLLQATLQIPFGMLSDRIGRKKVITIGLVLLAVGSVIAALADNIYWVLLGRALQGSGAIAAVLMALAADLTRDEQRTKVMAMLGASIGASFILAIMLGPVLIGWYSINVLFWLTAASAVAGIVLLHTVVPDPDSSQFNADTGASLRTMRRLLRDGQLLRLDASIFLLHLIITATFYSVPLALLGVGFASGAHWQVYLVAVILSLAVMVPLIIMAERRSMRGVLLICAMGMLITQLWFGFLEPTLVGLFIGVILFFCFLNALEALLPSLVSRLAPAAAKGSAMGIYSSSQFLGAFAGGAGAGWLHGAFGRSVLFLVLALLCMVWLLLLLGFKSPTRAMTTHRRALSADEKARSDSVIDELKALPGVLEVVLAVDEGVAYMKVDKKLFQPLQN